MEKVSLIVLDPGHFHAALLQKSMFPGVDSIVHVFAPKGNEVDAYLAFIQQYNSRAELPTKWHEEVYLGDDFLKKMVTEKPGNLVVIAGNNRKKTRYIHEAVSAGLNVLSDKPMVINATDFELLKEAFSKASKSNALLYDMMTSRYEITNILEKELSQDKLLFGELVKGTEDDPAVSKQSTHYFFKSVSGKPLVRPAWYFDTDQNGEGIVDITTHLVDLVQWECFPENILEYKKDIAMLSAKRWATKISEPQFKMVTQKDSFPSYLQKDIKDDTLNVYANGEMNYTIKGIHTRVSVTWDFQAPEGTGDSYFSTMRGTKANISIRQGKEQAYLPT
ncbi:MAG: putative oxidoreductase C-terminal domain-containing protein, partial [Ginsengibacter sp.]